MNSQIVDFYLKTPLYAKIPINTENWEYFKALFKGQIKFEGYNPIHKTLTVYKTEKIYSSQIEKEGFDHFINHNAIFKTTIKCQKYNNVFTFFGQYLPVTAPNQDLDLPEKTKKGTLIKIGQDVSLIAFKRQKIDKWGKLLSDEKQVELIKALGYASHGTGIASFIYLQRIFEELMDDIYLLAQKENLLNHNKYDSLTMADKANLLKEYLPVFSTDNEIIYSVLCTERNKLNEQLCLEYFNVVLLGIEKIMETQLV